MDLNLKKDRNVRRKPSIDVSSMVYGKIPPQSKDMEEAVLGAIMLEKGAFDTVIEILKPECFYVEAHQKIFASMQAGKDTLMLIGPEGDFTAAEVNLALEKGFQPVSLGNTRLRTETAGVVACVLMKAVNG